MTRASRSTAETTLPGEAARKVPAGSVADPAARLTRSAFNTIVAWLTTTKSGAARDRARPIASAGPPISVAKRVGAPSIGADSAMRSVRCTNTYREMAALTPLAAPTALQAVPAVPAEQMLATGTVSALKPAPWRSADPVTIGAISATRLTDVFRAPTAASTGTQAAGSAYRAARPPAAPGPSAALARWSATTVCASTRMKAAIPPAAPHRMVAAPTGHASFSTGGKTLPNVSSITASATPSTPAAAGVRNALTAPYAGAVAAPSAIAGHVAVPTAAPPRVTMAPDAPPSPSSSTR